MTLPVLSDGDAQQHEVGVFGRLSKPEAGRLFVAMLNVDYREPVGDSAELCLTELLARTDLAEVHKCQMRMNGNGDDGVVVGFSIDVVECLGEASPEDDVPGPSPSSRASSSGCFVPLLVDSLATFLNADLLPFAPLPNDVG